MWVIVYDDLWCCCFLYIYTLRIERVALARGGHWVVVQR